MKEKYVEITTFRSHAGQAPDAGQVPEPFDKKIINRAFYKMELAGDRAELALKTAVTYDGDLSSSNFKSGLKKTRKQIRKFRKAFSIVAVELMKLPRDQRDLIFGVLNDVDSLAPSIESHADMLIKLDWRDVDKFGIENCFFFLLEALEARFFDFYAAVTSLLALNKESALS